MRRRGARLAVLGAAILALAGPWAGTAMARETGAPRPAPLRLEGVVSRVSDGDTLWIRPVDRRRKPVKVRLLGIDAPETCQAGGEAARQALAGRVLQRRVVVETSSRDDYGRALGRVWLDGEDVNAWLVASGHAWGARTRRSQAGYAAEQRQAQAAGLGLFADPQALPPWTFRRTHGPCRGGLTIPSLTVQPRVSVG